MRKFWTILALINAACMNYAVAGICGGLALVSKGATEERPVSVKVRR